MHSEFGGGGDDTLLQLVCVCVAFGDLSIRYARTKNTKTFSINNRSRCRYGKHRYSFCPTMSLKRVLTPSPTPKEQSRTSYKATKIMAFVPKAGLAP